MVVNNLELGVAALASAATVVLYNYSGDIAKATAPDHKYQAGEDYHSEKKKAKNFFADPKAITAALLRSQTRINLTNKLIDTLWDNLQHPPLSYMGGSLKVKIEGDKTEVRLTDTITYKSPENGVEITETMPLRPHAMHQYRTPDGSYNNILSPDLGRAGTPYAKSVLTSKKLHGVKPDPGLLFDLLMAREEGTFKENPAGISSILFYHASIIIHDIFRTNRTNMNISDTSSYLDLAPLYGSSLADQLEIRTMKEGKLKPDTFHEKRLLGQPPGVNVMLIMYNRFHNYVAEILLKINENGRFTLAKFENPSPEDIARAVAKQDHDLFNTARLIVGGLYINICLHDYLRAITNTHHSDSNWTLDPRVDIDKHFDPNGAPRGIGNQVSVEFNLLYRFHSCISKRDEKWTEDFFQSEFPGKTIDEINKLDLYELLGGLQKFFGNVNPDPSKREFGGLRRQENGMFNDEELVRVMKEGMEDPAGCFGARNVPKALRVVEILGIVQGRKWQVASLNEFREFFGLKRHATFSDINSDKDIASVLEKLYTHPDMVEMYPGIMIENHKPAMDPGCGICPTYSVGRAVLSDAITLVRSDRFNTLDYTVSNLTAWGYNEVQQDYKTLGGSLFYKLIQRALPGWFPFNSLHVMQPMYTKKANEAIAKEIGTISLYTEADPKPPRPVHVLAEGISVREVLHDERFVVPWLPAVNDLFPGSGKDFSWFMLAGDKPENAAQKRMVQEVFHSIPGFEAAISSFVAEVGSKLLAKETFKMKEGLNQIDIIRDIAIPMNAQLLSDIFYLDLRTDENKSGSLSTAEFYKHLLNIRIWGVNNNDPAMAWNRRRWAQEGAAIMTKSGRDLVRDVANEKGASGFAGYLASAISDKHKSRSSEIKQNSLRSCGHKIVQGFLSKSISPEKTADICWLTAFGGIGVPVTTLCEIMQFFLNENNKKHWSQVQSIAAAGDDQTLRLYTLEAMRLTTAQRNLRIATQPAMIDGKDIKPGDAVLLLLGQAGRDPSVVQDADKFIPTRKQDGLITPFSTGPHDCVGRQIAMNFIVGMVKLFAGLKDLRPAPGQMGIVKTIQVGTERCYLNDSWSWLSFDASTWKLHFSGHGKGSFKAPPAHIGENLELSQIEAILGKNKDEKNLID
ncbi:hypothetical protein COCHEDRAFT_1219837 [Bipolaris maydis C5]|uniref:linoleate 8R-lipoxygenase n=1 Tax=Cochliobolus heterostrophus (strain C5 / ATCC 48332 / race O) TaxID=701091 RepID=M2TSV8_COCH5|nr:hypothetical protein COCHEDRAFT_1219837 [Bipolaris maydis C5]